MLASPGRGEIKTRSLPGQFCYRFSLFCKMLMRVGKRSLLVYITAKYSLLPRPPAPQVCWKANTSWAQVSGSPGSPLSFRASLDPSFERVVFSACCFWPPSSGEAPWPQDFSVSPSRPPVRQRPRNFNQVLQFAKARSSLGSEGGGHGGWADERQTREQI